MKSSLCVYYSENSKLLKFLIFYIDRNESEFIQDIIKWVDSIMVNRTFLNVARYLVRIESRVRDIYQHLSMGRNDIICMVGIFETGGIGKTTIAKENYNRISYQFEGSCFLSKVGGLIQLQKTLLYEIFGISLDFHDIDRRINVIRHRLFSKRVLLILDDVDELVELETLPRALDWFGLGTRIIITARDQHLLNISKVDSKYKLKILANDEALKHFSLHAFEKDEPLDEYHVELSKQVLQYAQGLPLALTVLGSTLKDQSIHQWKSVLNRYKQIPDINIQSVLRSYDSLEDNEKDMFLDIACFFKVGTLADVIKIFDNCGFSLDYDI
ncbi:hypothetical protein I3842_15G103800 [Carya illinoinensis]|nr:hypothetical protein I3842_15G103800 [Carya illinoinensis]